MALSSFGKGVLYAVFSYLVWGLLPIYWRLLDRINSMHILAFRILFSLLLISLIFFFQKNTSWLKFYKDRRKTILLTISGILVCISWGIFVWAVNRGQTIEAALGYYINPLFSIVLGMCFLREKLKPLQIIAFLLALTGVLILTILTGSLPWVSLGLAITFAFYGLIKKKIGMPALESVGIETLIVAPVGFILLLTPLGTYLDGGYPNPEGISYLTSLPIHTLLILPLAGAATTLPLFLFSKGANLLPLSTLGFIQFISPTMNFLTGVFLFREHFPLRNLIVFCFIWSSAIVYIISLRVKDKNPG